MTSVLSVFCITHSAYASTSGNIIFRGSIVKNVCALDDLGSTEIQSPLSSKLGKVPFNLTFSGCNISSEDININFYDLIQGKASSVSKSMTFNVFENKQKLIEIEGKKTYQPMQLKGHYTHRDNHPLSAKLVIVEYH